MKLNVKKEWVMDRIRVFLWLVALFNLSVAVFQQSILSGVLAVVCAVAAIIAPHIQNYLNDREVARGNR